MQNRLTALENIVSSLKSEIINEIYTVGSNYMKKIINEELKNELEENYLSFEIAKKDDIVEILDIYSERMKWFKSLNIKQWTRYLYHHPKEEFEEMIKNKNLYVLKHNNEIIACWELSYDSKYWDSNDQEAIYIYKLVTKVGTKNIAHFIFKIVEQIAILNKKKYIRLDCLKSNHKLNEIYEKHNFKLVRTGYVSGYSFSLREFKVEE